MAGKKHKFAGASVEISTKLDPSDVAGLCEVAAKEAGSLQVLVRLEESDPGRLVYSARNRPTGGRVEFLTFEVTMKDTEGKHLVRSRILSYKVQRDWVLFVPLPWRMMAWRNYRSFMYKLAALVRSSDPTGSATVVELAGAR